MSLKRNLDMNDCIIVPLGHTDFININKISECLLLQIQDRFILAKKIDAGNKSVVFYLVDAEKQPFFVSDIETGVNLLDEKQIFTRQCSNFEEVLYD